MSLSQNGLVCCWKFANLGFSGQWSDSLAQTVDWGVIVNVSGDDTSRWFPLAASCLSPVCLPLLFPNSIHCYPLLSITNQCQPLLTYYRSPSRLFGCEVWPSFLPANWFATGGFCIKELIQFATCVLICQIQSIDEAVGVVGLSGSMCQWIYRCCAPTVTYAIRRERQWLSFKRCLRGIGLRWNPLLRP